MAITVTDNSFIRVDTLADILFAVAIYTEKGFPLRDASLVLDLDWQQEIKSNFIGGATVSVRAGGITCELVSRNQVAQWSQENKRYLKEIEVPTMWQILNEPDLSSFFD